MIRIPFCHIDCSGNESKYVNEVLESGWLTTASKAKHLEQEFSTITGAKYAYAVNSCTSALHLALDAVGIKQGDKVLVPTWTFTASAEVIRYLGADPVFLDVEYGSCALTPDIVSQALSDHADVKALIVVHFGGQAVQMGKEDAGGILSLCRDYGVWLIEDAAHAFPSKSDGVMVGNIGDVTCFSFYANKTITTGEGGMLTTNNDAIAERVQLMRLHGINRDVWNRFTEGASSWEYDVQAPGFKYNMPDVNAAIGLAQLERVASMRNLRQKCAEFYFSNLADLEGLDLPLIKVPYEDHAWHLFPVFLGEKNTSFRNALINKLAEDGIGTSVHYKPLHRMSYYKERYNLQPDDYPNSENMWKCCLSLPIYPGLKEDALSYICERLHFHLK